MRKTFIRTLSCLCVVLMACGTAFAQQGKIQSGPYKGPMGPMSAPEAPDAAPFYSNLVVDACTGMKYSAANGYFILGPNNCFAPGSTQWVAYIFVAGKSGTVSKVQLSLTNDTGICTPTSSKVTVGIYSDNCTGTPATLIGSPVVATVAAAPPALANANFGTAGVSLTQGTNYWVVVTTSAANSQNGDTAVWWEANSGVEAFNFNDGNGWVFNPAASPGGFLVQ